MSLIIPLPRLTRERIAAENVSCHPGLLLDKFAESWDPGAGPGKLSERVQSPTLIKVVESSSRCPAGLDWRSLLDRRGAMLADLHATTWPRTTAGSLTLHLARASALENAGICLHPIYGFAYLPGTGLKGLARAYAETVWLASLPAEKQSDGWRTIEKVFGWAPGSDQIAPKTTKPWKPDDPCLKHHASDAAASGSIVFQDAWPETWPKLTIDIVNNHHPEYYKGNGPPGDWESPIPVYFLAVPPGQTFCLALGKQRDDVPGQILEQAQQWLDGGLTYLGFGAKTAAGYGRFQTRDGKPASLGGKHPRFTEFETKLTLVTPAFLAGAMQEEADCDLRPATLRGLLRWWWRTMHAGFLECEAMRTLEAAIWGNTAQGSRVQIDLRPGQNSLPLPYDYRDKSDPRKRYDVDPDFARRHGLASRPDNKTSQGLFYASYGMDDAAKGKGAPRHHHLAGATWMLRVIARESACCPAQMTLDQAIASLWLLVELGSVGSKANKGFGSMAATWDTAVLDLHRCRGVAAEFRRQALGRETRFVPAQAMSPSLENLLGPFDYPTVWDDVWYALDQMGYAYQAIAKDFKHDEAKLALGLPRQIHGPRKEAMSGQVNHRKPVRLEELIGLSRHASPVHIHLSRSLEHHILIRALAFPSPRLPDASTSRSFLERFLDEFGRQIERRGSVAPILPESSRTRTDPAPHRVPPKRVAQTVVNVTVLGPREEGKKGYRVKEEGHPEGVITLGPVPSPPPEPGSRHDVWMKDDDPVHPQYEWIDPTKTKKTQPDRRGGGGPRGRR